MVDNLDPREEYIVRWHTYLKTNVNPSGKTPQNSFSITLLITAICFNLVFLLNSIVFNDRLSRCYFIQSSIFTLICFIYYYPTLSLTFYGTVHYRIIKWVFIITMMSTVLFLIRTQPELCSLSYLAITIGVKLFRSIPIIFDNTITFTELLIGCQLMLFAAFTYITHFLKIILADKAETLVTEQAILWLLGILFVMNHLTFIRNSLFLFVILAIIMLFGPFMLFCQILMEKNPFVWLYEFIFFDSIRVYLLVYWFALFICISFVLLLQECISQSNLTTKCSLTSMRKLFHALICCVFIPGLIYDRSLLRLCSYGMLILLAIVEIIRYFNMGELGKTINYLMQLFVDEKDRKGKLILSHIYLLIGLSFPLWISPSDTIVLAEFCGVLAIGVGDSFASLVGSRFGSHKWPDSPKSIEGTLAFIFSQMISYWIFHVFQIVDIFREYNFILLLASNVLTAFVETFTQDNDNLILAVIAYPLLIIVK